MLLKNPIKKVLGKNEGKNKQFLFQNAQNMVLDILTFHRYLKELQGNCKLVYSSPNIVRL